MRCTRRVRRADRNVDAARHADVLQHVDGVHHAPLVNIEAETPEKVAEEQEVVENMAGFAASHACHRAVSRDAMPG